MTTKQIWEIDDYNRIIDGTTKVLLFTVDTSSDDDPLPIMRKIAAAPAMYEALQMVATTLYDMADSAGDVPEWNESGELYELSRTVRAALAQAEGRDK